MWIIFLGFTGVDQVYEAPTSADVDLKAGELSVDECVQKVVSLLAQHVSFV